MSGRGMSGRGNSDRGIGLPAEEAELPEGAATEQGCDPRLATTLIRGLSVLRAFRARDSGLTNGEISRRTGLAKATVSRLSYTLTHLGYLQHDAQRGTYNPGPGLLTLAHSYLAQMDIRAIAHPFMERLAEMPGVTVSLAARDRLNLVTIEAVMADTPVSLRVNIGARAPIAVTALGHAYLAGLKAPVREAVLAEIQADSDAAWPKTEALIRANLTAIAEQGYCMALGEWRAQINGVAVPIRSLEGQEVFAMSCGGPAQLLPKSALAALGQELVAAKKEIERATGTQ